MKKTKFTKTIIIFLLTLGLLLPGFSLAQIEAPETIEEAKELGEEFFQKSKEQLPQIIGRLWKEEVLPIWRKMYEIWSNWWDFSIQPWLQNIWQRVMALFGQEIEKRKPQIEEELEKEKEELKEELPDVTKSLWERFKELIK